MVCRKHLNVNKLVHDYVVHVHDQSRQTQLANVTWLVSTSAARWLRDLYVDPYLR
jgi:hypothetical protein